MRTAITAPSTDRSRLSRTALVTGACGLIGSNVNRALFGAGYDIRPVDRVAGEDVRDFFRRNDKNFDVVVHCAASVAGVDKRNAPGHLVNLEIDAAFWQWVIRTRPGYVVYFSSSCAYPLRRAHMQLRLREADIDLDTPEWPDGLYGWGKLTGELLARTAAGEGVPVGVVRPFSVYGPADAMRDGFAVKSFAAQVARRADPVEVWGDAGQVRDFIHVDDVAAAVAAMVSHRIEDPVNLGTGRGTGLAELVALMGKAAGYTPQVKVDAGMPAGVPRLVADNTLLRTFCPPQVTLEDHFAGVFP